MVKTLEKYMAEIHAGLREGSVISTHTAHTVEELDSDELWLGLTPGARGCWYIAAASEPKERFSCIQYQTAIAEGTLEEKISNNDDDLLTPPPQHNNTLGLSPITPSKPLLQTVWRFLAKILQDDKKLRTAAAVGNIATVTEQLNYGIDPDAKNESTLKTALYCAAEHGHVDITWI
jgi:hypothetical protein